LQFGQVRPAKRTNIIVCAFALCIEIQSSVDSYVGVTTVGDLDHINSH
jgi:hypothetical protein